MPSLEGLEELADDLYEDAPCGYLSTTIDGTIVRANRTFLEWAGYDTSAIVHRKRFQELLSPGGRIYHETHYSPLLQMQGAAREIALDIVAEDGRRLPAIVNAVVKELEDGRRVVRIAVLPAADRREYERELLRARKSAEESEERARVLAQTLQASLIPPAAPAIPDMDVGAVYRPAGEGDEVGGDFYDVFEIARGDWAIVIGDVRGKGAQAAAVTALARYTVRAAAIQVRKPSLILGLLNEAMLRQHPDTFCTIAYARVRPQSDRARVTLASGGHPLPVLASAAGTAPAGEPGMLIGAFPDPSLHDKTITLAPGDSLTFVTDGVTEGRRGNDFYGDQRLVELVHVHRDASAARLAQTIVDDVLDFQGGDPRDDIAVVTLRVPEARAGA